MVAINDMVELTVECSMCHKTQVIKVSRGDYRRWQNGTLIQNAFPYLTPGQREMLKTQTCDECWDKLFSPDDE